MGAQLSVTLVGSKTHGAWGALQGATAYFFLQSWRKLWWEGFGTWVFWVDFSMLIASTLTHCNWMILSRVETSCVEIGLANCKGPPAPKTFQDPPKKHIKPPTAAPLGFGTEPSVLPHWSSGEDVQLLSLSQLLLETELRVKPVEQRAKAQTEKLRRWFVVVVGALGYVFFFFLGGGSFNKHEHFILVV